MRWRRGRGMIWVVVALEVGAPRAFAVAGSAAPDPRVVVVPVQDRRSDPASRQLTESLAQALEAQAFRVLPRPVTQAIQEYQPAVSGPAVTDPAALAVHTQLQIAKRQFLDFHNRPAQAAVTQVIRAFAAHPEWRGSHGDWLAEAYLTQALIAQGQHRASDVEHTLQQLALLAPHFELPTSEVPPSLRERWGAAQQQVRAGGTSAVTIVSRPAAAAVRINGVAAGTTPLHITLPAGEYAVQLAATRYRPVHRPLSVTADRPVTLRERLVWADAATAAEAGSSAAMPPVLAAALQVAETSGADRAVVVDVDAEPHRVGEIRAQVIDAQARLGWTPHVVPVAADRAQVAEQLSQLAGRLAEELRSPRLPRAAARRTYAEWGTPASLTQRPRRRVPVVVWIGLGAAVLGGTLAGVLLSRDGNTPPAASGGIVVQFR